MFNISYISYFIASAQMEKRKKIIIVIMQIHFESSQKLERRKRRRDVRLGGESVTISKQLLLSPLHVLADSNVQFIKNT